MIQPAVMAPPLNWLVSDAAGGVTGRRFLAVPMATELGGEWECWYHFLYWSVSSLTHPSGLGIHTYVKNLIEGSKYRGR